MGCYRRGSADGYRWCAAAAPGSYSQRLDGSGARAGMDKYANLAGRGVLRLGDSHWDTISRLGKITMQEAFSDQLSTYRIVRPPRPHSHMKNQL